MSMGLLAPPLGPRKITLWPPQEEAVDAVRNEFRKGIKSTLAIMATGIGKSVTFGEMARLTIENDGRALILAHTDTLIKQAAGELDLVGVTGEIEKAGQHARTHYDPDCVVGSVQTLMRPRRLAKWPRDYFNLIIVDECFPAGTPIDGRPIETIKAGDRVWSYNHETDRPEPRRVIRTFCRPAISLVRIHLSNGTSFVCTPNHPIFTIGENFRPGYIPAIVLNQYNMVLGITPPEDTDWSGLDGYLSQNLRDLRNDIPASELEQYDDADVLAGMQEDPARTASESRDPALHLLRQADRMQGRKCIGAGETGAGLLLRGVQGGGEESLFVRGDGQDQSEIRLGSDEGQEPDARPGRQGEDGNHSPGDGLETTDPGRQRQGADPAAATPGFRPGLAGHGICYPDQGQEEQPRTAADPLQGRHRTSDAPRGDRDRRAIARRPGPKRARPEEGRLSPIAWVDRVEVLEPGDNGEFGGLCPESLVYNLEVEGNHNYFADGYLVHNCHHSTGGSYRRIFNHFNKARIVGVTATAKRADGVDLGTVYESIAYQFTLGDAVRAPEPGPYLVEPEYHVCPIDIDLRGLRPRGEDFTDADLVARITPMIEVLANTIFQEAEDRISVVFTPMVRPAQGMADALQRLGMRADWVSGDDPDKDLKIEAFKCGRLQTLCCAILLTEGFNHPPIEDVYICRPTKSRVLLSQMAGRATRLWQGKTKARIVSFNYLTDGEELVHPVELYDRPDMPQEVLDIAKEMAEKDKQLPLSLAIEEAEKEHVRRKALRVPIQRRQIHYKKVVFSPLATYERLGIPWRGSRNMDAVSDRATDKQVAALERFGVEGAGAMSVRRASILLDNLIARSRAGLSSHKQIGWLVAEGVDIEAARAMTYKEAKAFLTTKWGPMRKKKPAARKK